MWWRLLGGGAVLGLIGFLVWIYGNSKFNAGELAERDRWKDAAIKHEQQIARIERGWYDRLSAAQTHYSERIETVRPFLVTNKETVTRYAETPAGRMLCLVPERVLGIEQTRTGLFPQTTVTAGDGARALLAEPASEGLGGSDEQR